MGAQSADRVTLLDWARRLDPDGKIATVAETLNKFSEVLDDIPWYEGNLPTGHKTTVRSSLPTPSWRLFNQGVSKTKSTTTQIVETCGMLEAYSEIDKDLAMLNGNTSQFRYTEDLAHIEALNQEFCTTLVYGDTSTDPEEFVGLAPRYYSKSAGTCSANVIDAGGTPTTNTSMWLVAWGPNTAFGIFPKGSKAGLNVQDLGEQTVYDGSNNPFQAYRSHFQWKCGLAIKDWRYVVRIANINATAVLTASDSSDSSANLLKYMSQALDTIPPNGTTNLVFYANQRVRSMLRAKILAKSNMHITLEEMQSPISMLMRPTLKVFGVPVRRIDEILNTETAI